MHAEGAEVVVGRTQGAGWEGGRGESKQRAFSSRVAPRCLRLETHREIGEKREASPLPPPRRNRCSS